MQSPIQKSGETNMSEEQPPQKMKGVADIVFLIDATGSMAPCIEALKANIAKFIDTLSTKNSNNELPVQDWRAAVVGFRDAETDGAHWIEDNPFVRSAEELKAQLAALRASGGDDEPESLLDGLHKVVSRGQTGAGATEDPRQWRFGRSAHRVVIIFSDATFKPRLSVPEAKGQTVDDVINLCHQNRIKLFIFAPEFDCYNGLSQVNPCEWEAIPFDSGDHHGPQKALAEFTSDQQRFVKVLEHLAKTISQTAGQAVV
jgi:hypothetical protein